MLTGPLLDSEIFWIPRYHSTKLVQDAYTLFGSEQRWKIPRVPFDTRFVVEWRHARASALLEKLNGGDTIAFVQVPAFVPVGFVAAIAPRRLHETAAGAIATGTGVGSTASVSVSARVVSPEACATGRRGSLPAGSLPASAASTAIGATSGPRARSPAAAVLVVVAGTTRIHDIIIIVAGSRVCTFARLRHAEGHRQNQRHFERLSTRPQRNSHDCFRFS
jgi:hypothetical protein